MGRLTPEKEARIYETYLKELGYEKTAKEEGVSWKTVKRIVDEKRAIASPPADAPQVQGTEAPAAPDAQPPLERMNAKKSKPKSQHSVGTKEEKLIENFEKAGDAYYQFLKEKYKDLDIEGMQDLGMRMRKHTIGKKYPELAEFDEILERQGKLKGMQILALAQRYKALKGARPSKIIGKLFMPFGWEMLSCELCDTIVLGASPLDESGSLVLTKLKGTTHLGCGGHLKLHVITPSDGEGVKEDAKTKT